MYLPRITTYTLDTTVEGWAAWALQRALNSLGATLLEDGRFGAKTKAAVVAFQAANALAQDGVAGGRTQAKIARLLIAAADPDGLLPDKLEESHIWGESNAYLAAVNWNVEGGVDLGVTQRRVYTPTWKKPWPDYEAPFDSDEIKRALDTSYQVKLLARNLRGTHDIYLSAKNADGSSRYPATRTHELAWRLAVMHHNYPSGADKVAAVGMSNLSGYWITPQDWVKNIDARFPDGVPIATPKDWMAHYALGSAEHSDAGFMVKLVTSWTTSA